MRLFVKSEAESGKFEEVELFGIIVSMYLVYISRYNYFYYCGLLLYIFLVFYAFLNRTEINVKQLYRNSAPRFEVESRNFF
jgi:hypothetical protein